ncbi:MAG: DNA replication and repair protein RecF, partial [Xanthomonadaceae bacterium]|nr:DNA replication and repair protein RecF [Xanthomonadaceae bacterium]
ERRSSEWIGRIDGRPCSKLSEFARALPLVVVDPSSHELIEGGPGERRAYLDWGLFHVEQSYLDNWKRYSRLLRQRNAALRASAASATLDALEKPLSVAAEKIEQARAAYAGRLQNDLQLLEARLRFRLDPLTVRYRSQFEFAEGYAELWKKSRTRDLEHGYTREGPHRGELVIRVDAQIAASRLSRGQMKLAALLLKLGQMQHLTSAQNTPILLLDDPVSELDSKHFEQLLDWVMQAPIQSWITAIQAPSIDHATVFHVEQGEILEMV